MGKPLLALLNAVTSRRTFKNNVFGTDAEALTHEMAHLLTLIGAAMSEEMLRKALADDSIIDVNRIVLDRKATHLGRDHNEILTTAVTILAMERLGGGDIGMSLDSMLGNLNVVDKDVSLLLVTKWMLRKATRSKAKKLAELLTKLDEELSISV